ncbi:MAG: sulfate transporter [Deltaproteobacteria bacterium]|nr:sulfate transporter [Deltaproteobacteria bacterium]
MKLAGNTYDRMELAGAFGDLGTLIPFVLGYITLTKLDPAGVLLAFGLGNLAAGLWFRTPVGVQPMKAIGAAAISQGEWVTPGMIWSAGAFTALFWLTMGLSGAIAWVARVTTKPVVRGLMLGLGLSFVLEGLGMMREQPVVAIAGALIVLLLLSSTRAPAMLVLLAFGTLVAFWQQPGLFADLRLFAPALHLPTPRLGGIGAREMLSGIVLLALPQAALTVGNAIIGMAAEHNEHFPDRPVTVQRLSLSHGLLNAISAAVGGAPMCHGAGAVAGHVRFGARTGGSMVILGLLLAGLGLFYGYAAVRLLQAFPRPLLGTILVFAGVELASMIRDIRGRRPHVFIVVITAGVAIWNVGVAYLVGLLLYYAVRRGLITI